MRIGGTGSEWEAPHEPASVTHSVNMKPQGKIWSDAIGEWGRWLAAGGKSVETRKQRLYHLRRFSQEVGKAPWSVSVDDLAEYLSNPVWGAEARRSCRAALRGFYTWAQATGRRKDNPGALLPPIKAPRGRPRPAPQSALEQALARADERTRLMVRLAACEGLRRGEIARAHTRDLVDTPDGWSLRVLGKGGVVRVVPVGALIAATIRQMPEGFLFPGKIDGHLSPAYVGKLVSRVLPQGYTTHTLRHRFASIAYATERDIRAVQELLGHATVATTQIYTAIPDGALRRAVAGAAA